MHGRLIAGLWLSLALPLITAGCTTHMPSGKTTETTGKANPTGSATGHARIGAWGDDFFRYADGKWIDTNQIPPDRTSWTSFVELADRAEHDIRAIVESLPNESPEGSAEQKARDFYRAYLDTESIERNGLAPAQPGLDAIASTRTHEQLADLMGRPDLGLKSPLLVAITRSGGRCTEDRVRIW
jgi:putative endopeptidase